MALHTPHRLPLGTHTFSRQQGQDEPISRHWHWTGTFQFYMYRAVAPMRRSLLEPNPPPIPLSTSAQPPSPRVASHATAAILRRTLLCLPVRYARATWMRSQATPSALFFQPLDRGKVVLYDWESNCNPGTVPYRTVPYHTYRTIRTVPYRIVSDLSQLEPLPHQGSQCSSLKAKSRTLSTFLATKENHYHHSHRRHAERQK